MMPTASGEFESTNAQPSFWRRMIIIVLFIVAFLILIYVSRLAIHGWALYQSARQIESTLQVDRSTAALSVIGTELQQITDSTSAVERQMAPLTPFFSLFDGVTTYGSTVAAGLPLMRIGTDYLDIANEALGILTPALMDAAEQPDLNAFVAALSEAGPELAALAPLTEETSARLAEIDVTQLHPALAEPLSDLQIAAPQMSTGLRLAPYASELLGFDTPKTYLILVQNNHELRATGGFISAVGLLTLDEGQITEMDFQDSYQFFNREGEYSPAPLAMQTYMDIPLLLLRDANWSPDLPTTAHLARTLFQQETGVEVDGIVTVDLHAVERLVGGLGRLNVEGVEQPITGDNIAEIVTTLWAQPLGTDAEADAEISGDWWRARKNFMPALANAALARIESGNVDLTAMVLAALASLDSRSVQVWLDDPAIATILRDSGWDGAIAPPDDGDYLALVDTNMGYNKVNAVLEREMTHQVTWPDLPGERATVTTSITYHHPVEIDGHICDQSPRYGATYDEMTARCYFNYLRLYVPGDSQLIDADGFELDSVTSKRGERGTEMFTGWFVLPPGEEQTVSFTYRLPPEISEETYRLVVQRQSGTGPLALNGWIGNRAIEAEIERGRFEWSPN